MKRPRLQALKPRVAVANLTRTAGSPASVNRDSRRVYESRRWRERVRPAKLRRDPLCQRCKHLGLVVPAEHVDHWQRIGEGGDAWHESNLVSLCEPCHGEKSALERAERPLFEVAPSAPQEATWL